MNITLTKKEDLRFLHIFFFIYKKERKQNMMKKEKTLQQYQIQEGIHPAVHIEWEELDSLISKLLSVVLSQSINAKTARYDFTCWSLRFPEAPLSDTDLKYLYGFFHMDDPSPIIEPITELSQFFSERIINALLPFELTLSIAKDSGVWFIGSAVGKFLTIQGGTHA